MKLPLRPSTALWMTELRTGYEANKPFDCAQDDIGFRNTWTKDGFCAAE